MGSAIRPLPQIPQFPVYQVTDVADRQYLLMWNAAQTDAGVGDIDHLQIAVGPPGVRPEIIVTSRSATGESLESTMQLAMLALNPASMQRLSGSGADTSFDEMLSIVTSSLHAEAGIWTDVLIQLDEDTISARMATTGQEWVAVAAVPGAFMAVVGRNIPLDSLAFATVPPPVLEKLTQPNDGVLTPAI